MVIVHYIIIGSQIAIPMKSILKNDMPQSRVAMKKLIFFLCLNTIFMSIGCIPSAVITHSYTPPASYNFEYETIISKPFVQVWDHLNRQLSESEYKLEKAERDTRLIYMSFSPEKPEVYIDCGKVIRTFKVWGEDLRYEYESAGSSSFKTANFEESGDVFFMDRKTSLKCDILLYVAPESETSTIINIYIKFFWKNDVFIRHKTETGDFSPIDSPDEMDSSALCTCTSRQKGYIDIEGYPLDFFCATKGVLEKKIMDLVKGSQD